MASTPTEYPPAEPDGLLEGFLAQIVADDYATVTSRESGGVRGSRRWVSIVTALAIGVLIATALINNRLSSDERQQTRGALTDRVSALSTAVAERQTLVDEQSSTVEQLQQELLDTPAQGAQADRITQLAALAGTSDLAGPGVVVTIDDAPDAQEGSLNTVLDRDLQDIVNVLWRMGATGVAVNDQRLTDVTAIRSAGDAILVNYQPLTRPYRVTAIGPSASDDSGLGSLLSTLADDYGLVTEVSSGDVALPAGELRSPRYAKPTTGGDEQ